MKAWRRHWRWLLLWAWLGTSIAATIAVDALTPLFDPDTQALTAHPVRTQATVIDAFIDGMGGDPAVDYKYRVGGRWYTGWGDGGGIAGANPLCLRRGDHIVIEYAARRPSASCPCDVRSSDASISKLPVFLIGGLTEMSSLISVLMLVVAGSEAAGRRGSRRSDARPAT